MGQPPDVTGEDLVGIDRVQGVPVDQGGIDISQPAIEFVGDKLLVQPKR
jgi:hypothetical protein